MANNIAEAASSEITNNTGASLFPLIAAYGTNNVYIIWKDDTTGNFDTFFVRSNNAGSSFDGNLNLSNNNGNTGSSSSGVPQIAISKNDGSIYVVWQDDTSQTSGRYEILFRKSTDEGSSFGSTLNLSNSPTQNSADPQIAVAGANVYVVWREFVSANNEIFFARSSDGGVNFSPPVNLSNTGSGNSNNPQLAASSDGSDVFVVWDDNSDGDFDTYVVRSTDSGQTFSSPINLSNNAGNGGSTPRAFPQIAVTDDGLGVYVVWRDNNSGNDEIMFVGSSDGGSIFGSLINLSNNAGDAAEPQITINSDGSQIYVVWDEGISGSQTSDVYFAQSTDFGHTFSSSTNLSNNTGASIAPQIGSEDGKIYVAWQDSYLGDAQEEIFAVESTDSGNSFSDPVNVSDNAGRSLSPQLALPIDGADGGVYIVWYDTTLGNNDIFFNGEIDFSAATISIDSITPEDKEPLWGIDIVTIQGSTTASQNNDKVKVDWGDGTSADVSIGTGGSWQASHTFDSTSVGTKEISARLVDSNNQERAVVEEPLSVAVQKHRTSLALNPVASVRHGNNIEVTGQLVDSANSDGPGIGGVLITFGGAGAENLSNVMTSGDGSFLSNGQSPQAIDTGWPVQAHFGGNSAYEASDSVIRTYDTASDSASEFEVAAGVDVSVNLDGFDASIDFDEISTAGKVFVAHCDDAPESDRYIALDELCLVISLGTTMPDDSFAHIHMSFANATIPAGYAANDIDVFHEDPPEKHIVDITEARDGNANEVTARTTTFGKFVGGIALHDARPANTVRSQVFVGNDGEISLRDVTSTEDVDAEISLDRSRYNLRNSPEITITDQEMNIDGQEVNTISVQVTSTSDATGITAIAEETEPDSGVFIGRFDLTRDSSNDASDSLKTEIGDNIQASYTRGAKFKAIFDNVLESGLAQAADFIDTKELDDCALQRITSAVELKLLDMELDSDGKIRVIMSYANVDTGDSNPAFLHLYHKASGGSWEDITLRDSGNNFVGNDIEAKTVTGETNTSGLFYLAYDVGCGGGAGGGVSRPGVGVVLDFIAPIVASGGGHGGSSNSNPDQSNTLSKSNSGKAMVETNTNVQATIALNGNKDALIKMDFESVLQSGEVTIDAIDPSDFDSGETGGIFNSISPDGSATIVFGDTTCTTVGLIYSIDTSSELDFDGTVDITIPYGGDLDSDEESNVRFLHYNEDKGEWEDATINIDTDSNTVTGRLRSFSPVVAGLVQDGTFGDTYFEFNPISKISSDTEITGTSLAKQLTISTTMKNLQQKNQTYTWIVQVTDQAGITHSIDWQTGWIKGGQTIELSLSWIAEDVGTYRIQTFLWDDFDNPSPISKMELEDYEIR